MRTYLWAILLILLPAALCAEIGVNQEVSFTVPQLSKSIRAWDLDDIDHDGAPEVLVSDSTKLVLYSYQLDSVYASVAIPPGYYQVQVLLADINRDSIADIVIGGTYDSTLTRQIRVLAWDGASGYTTTTVSKYARTDSFTGLTACGLIALQALDINADGYDELLVSYDSIATGTFTDYTPGNTYLYYSFPDSMSWKRYKVSTAMTPWLSRNDTSLFLYGDYYAYYTSLGNDYTYQLQTPHLCKQDGVSLKSFDTEHSGTCNSWAYLYSRQDRVSLECRGDIDQGSPGDEALIYYDYSYQCDFTGGTGARLEARSIVAADSLEPLWTMPLTPNRYDSFVYYPGFSGMFFAIDHQDNRVAQFDGASGALRQSSAVLPIGSYTWRYPYADSLPRLVVIDGHDVGIYTLDEATGIGDPDDPTLPNSFTLRDPYPNPFNPTTTLSLSLPHRGDLTVTVYDLLGRKVAVLKDGVVAAGDITLEWNASAVSSGVYFVRAQFEGSSQTVKAMLLK